jgi:hypothetical protein
MIANRMDSQKQRGIEIMEAIRTVLFEDWDPIGVNDVAPRDEYDAYIAGVYRMLCEGVTEDKIVAHLRNLAVTTMGLEETPTDDLRPVARKLLAIDIDLTHEGGGCQTPIANTKQVLDSLSEKTAALRVRLAVIKQDENLALRKTATDDAERSLVPKQLTVVRERVAKLVSEAFDGVTLGNGIGLWQGQAIDDYADAKTIATARLRDEKCDWRAISVDDLNRCHSSLCFFDAEGMRFHLPAFLLAELNGTLSEGITFTLTMMNDYRMKQFAVLSAAQRKSIRESLLIFKDDPDFEYERPTIESALADYWTEGDAQ